MDSLGHFLTKMMGGSQTNFVELETALNTIESLNVAKLCAAVRTFNTYLKTYPDKNLDITEAIRNALLAQAELAYEEAKKDDKTNEMRRLEMAFGRANFEETRN